MMVIILSITYDDLLDCIDDEKVKEILNLIVVTSKISDINFLIDFNVSYVDIVIESKEMINNYGPRKKLIITFDLNYRKKYLKNISYTFNELIKNNNFNNYYHASYYYRVEKDNCLLTFDFVKIIEKINEKFKIILTT